MSQGYNGWTNYETWCVNLWMTNDEGTLTDWLDRAGECYRDSEGESRNDRKEEAASAFAEHLKDDYEAAAADRLESSGMAESIWADFITASLSEVNWHEIAADLIGSLDLDEIEAESADEA